jgi:hypothetical protein
MAIKRSAYGVPMDPNTRTYFNGRRHFDYIIADDIVNVEDTADEMKVKSKAEYFEGLSYTKTKDKAMLEQQAKAFAMEWQKTRHVFDDRGEEAVEFDDGIMQEYWECRRHLDAVRAGQISLMSEAQIEYYVNRQLGLANQLRRSKMQHLMERNDDPYSFGLGLRYGPWTASTGVGKVPPYIQISPTKKKYLILPVSVCLALNASQLMRLIDKFKALGGRLLTSTEANGVILCDGDIAPTELYEATELFEGLQLEAKEFTVYEAVR